jgi:hypothetical protein
MSFADWISLPGERRTVIATITPLTGPIVRVAWSGTTYGGEYYAPRLKRLPSFSRTVPANGGEWASAGAGKLDIIDPTGELDLFGYCGASVSVQLGGPSLPEHEWAPLFVGHVGYIITRTRNGWDLELQSPAIKWDTASYAVGTTATTLDAIFSAVDPDFSGQAATEGIDYDLHSFNADADAYETGSRLLKRYSEGLPIVYGYNRAGIATLKKVVPPSGTPSVILTPTHIMQSGDTHYWTHDSHYHTYRCGYGTSGLNDSESIFASALAAADPAATDSDRQATTLHLSDQGVADAVGALFGQATRRRLIKCRAKGIALSLDLTDGVVIDYPRFGLHDAIGRIVGISDNVGQSITTDLVIML